LPYAPVGLFGTALSPERLAWLLDAQLGSITVALDAGSATTATALPTARRLFDELVAWGFTVRLATWVDGKDAGEGATLAPLSGGLSARLRHSLAR
jgi:hypothetical protein